MDTEQHRRRMVRLSRLTRGGALALAVLLPLAVAGYWAVAPDRDLSQAAGVAVSFGVGERLGGAVLSLLPVLALSWGLWRLAAMLRLFGEGRPLVAGTADGLRGFGIGVLACAALKPIVATALSLLVTWNGPGPHALAISVSSDTLLLVLLGAVLLLLGAALGEAALLAEDNAQIV